MNSATEVCGTPGTHQVLWVDSSPNRKAGPDGPHCGERKSSVFKSRGCLNVFGD